MYSFGEAHRDDELKTMSYYYTPGPGQYDRVSDDKVKDQYPAWKMGTSTRPPLYNYSNSVVGPGSYHQEPKDPKKFDKKTFAKGKRGQSELKGVTTVGPGSYNPKKFHKAYPQFSFGYKTDPFHTTDRALTPGPGQYDIHNPWDQFANTEHKPGDGKAAFLRTAPQAMSRSKDEEMGVKTGMPGPGEHYTPESENFNFRYFSPIYSFGTSTRDDLYNDERKHVPGPGKYNFAGGIKTKSGFTILGRHPTKGNSSDTPGPNVYNQSIDPLRKTAPSFRIGKSERTNLAMGSPDIPGPGNYYQDGQLLSNKGAKIGTSVRPMLHSQGSKKTPGPGEYNVHGEVGNTVKYSMGVKTHPKKASEVMPGPGEYEPFGSLYFEKNTGAIIGTSERPGLYKKASAPGPGQYDVRGNIGGGQKSKIGKGRRVPLAKVNDEPGPGFYNIPSAIGNVPKYLMPEYAKERRRKAAEKEVSFRGIFG